jgi:hypothetical protein
VIQEGSPSLLGLGFEVSELMMEGIDIWCWLCLLAVVLVICWFRKVVFLFHCRLTPVGDPPSPRAAHAATAVGTMVVIQVLHLHSLTKFQLNHCWGGD